MLAFIENILEWILFGFINLMLKFQDKYPLIFLFVCFPLLVSIGGWCIKGIFEYFDKN